MAGETIILRFVEYAPDLAAEMTQLARCFAVSHIDRPAGVRHGVVARFHEGGPYVVAYWTKARAVVVRELSGEAQP